MLTDRAIQIVAENKTRAAIDAGEFDKLPGFGKPAAIFDEPYDPHWWVRRKLKLESLTSIFEKTVLTTEAQRTQRQGNDLSLQI